MSRVLSQARTSLISRRARLTVFLAFLSFAALFGGGSRGDIQSLVLLRPLAALACAYAMALASPSQLRAVKFPLAMLIAYEVLHILQLVPLPPALWQALPKREVIAQAGEALAMGDLWRPLTLSPSRTLNSFFALLVPLAAVLLFAVLDPRDRRKTFGWLIGFAAVSAVVGIFQLLGGADGPLYLYRITNKSYPVGLFANRNHQGVLLAMAVFVFGWMIAYSDRLRIQRGPVVIVLSAMIVLLVLLAFVTGSRAGLILTIVAAIAAVWVMARSPIARRSFRVAPGRSISVRMVIVAFAVLLVGVGVAAVTLSRDAAFARLFAEDSLGGLRASALPVLLRMVADQGIFGTGFGTFEYAYKLYEPFALLQPQYLNQAHDDWAQLPIEGGLAGVGLLVILLGWLILRSWQLRARLLEARTQACPALFAILVLAAASAVDYPLHVPVLAAIAALMVSIIAVTPIVSNDEGGAS